MTRKKSIWLVSLIALLPAALGCDCGKSNNITADKALADRYYVGNSDASPGLDQFGQVEPGADPDQGELAVDFGQVDVNTLASRYLFIHNSCKCLCDKTRRTGFVLCAEVCSVRKSFIRLALQILGRISI